MTRCEPIVVGRIAAPYGIKGWIRIASFTSPPENLLDYAPWLTRSADGWQELNVDQSRAHGRGLVAHVAGCDDRNEAEALAGREIAVPSSVLPATEADEYYWKDLLGLEVVRVEGHRLGPVVRLIETGANDVLVVRGEVREHLIPFRKEFVVRVVLEKGLIEVDWDPAWETD
jgi:16S rRNA processing protein RimM